MNDAEYMEQHDRLRHKYFLPVRPVSTYRESLVQAGFRIADVQCRSIEADVDEWHSFLAVYHEGVLADRGRTEGDRHTGWARRG